MVTSTILCVSKCPENFLLTVDDMKSEAEGSGPHLCRYDIPTADFVSGTLDGLDCPPLPVIPQ